MARTLTVEIDLDRLNRYSTGLSERDALAAALTALVGDLYRGGPHAVWLGTANVGRARIDLDAVSPCAMVRIPDSDNPFGPPAYEGPADNVHAYLAPGSYQGMDENDQPVRVNVTETETRIAR